MDIYPGHATFASLCQEGLRLQFFTVGWRRHGELKRPCLVEIFSLEFIIHDARSRGRQKILARGWNLVSITHAFGLKYRTA